MYIYIYQLKQLLTSPKHYLKLYKLDVKKKLLMCNFFFHADDGV